MCLDKDYDKREVHGLLEEFGFTAHIRARGEEAAAATPAKPRQRLGAGWWSETTPGSIAFEQSSSAGTRKLLTISDSFILLWQSSPGVQLTCRDRLLTGLPLWLASYGGVHLHVLSGGRRLSVMKAYSLDLRQRIVGAADSGKFLQKEIAGLFSVTTRFVYKLLRQRALLGHIEPLPPWRRPPAAL